MVPPGCWIQQWHETSRGSPRLDFSLEALIQLVRWNESLTLGKSLAVIKMKNFICTKKFDFCKDALSLGKSFYVNRVTFCSVFLNLVISYFNVAFIDPLKWEA